MNLEALHAAWNRIETILTSGGRADDLNRGASITSIDALERQSGLALPPDVRESYLRHDGQAPHADDLVDAWQLLPVEQVAASWSRLRRIAPRGWRSDWLPFAANGLGDHLVLECGQRTEDAGRIILYAHETADRPIVASSFTEWLDGVAQRLEREDLNLGQHTSASTATTLPGMRALAGLLGLPLADERVATLLSSVPIDREEEGPETVLRATTAGFDVSARRGWIQQVDLYFSPSVSEATYRGDLLEGLGGGSSRSEVRRTLGMPSEQDQRSSAAAYDERVGWDAYVVDAVRIQFTYRADWQGISWITMTPASRTQA